MSDKINEEEEKTKSIIYGLSLCLLVSAICVSLFVVESMLKDNLQKARENNILQNGIVTEIKKEQVLFVEKYILTIETKYESYVKSIYIYDESEFSYDVGSEVVITRDKENDSILRIELSEDRSNVR